MGLIDASPNTYLPRDSNSGNLKMIGPEHCVIHDGTHFTAYHSVTVGTGTAATVLISTPAAASGYVHFVCGVEADKAITWTLSESPNASGGTAINSMNNNRNSDTTSIATLTHTVTYVSAGTVLENHIMGTNSPSTKTGGDAEIRNEWLLKPSTLYLVYATAAAADTRINIVMPYYHRA